MNKFQSQCSLFFCGEKVRGFPTFLSGTPAMKKETIVNSSLISLGGKYVLYPLTHGGIMQTLHHTRNVSRNPYSAVQQDGIKFLFVGSPFILANMLFSLKVHQLECIVMVELSF